jgi:hypothetical protein
MTAPDIARQPGMPRAEGKTREPLAEGGGMLPVMTAEGSGTRSTATARPRTSSSKRGTGSPERSQARPCPA